MMPVSDHCKQLYQATKNFSLCPSQRHLYSENSVKEEKSGKCSYLLQICVNTNTAKKKTTNNWNDQSRGIGRFSNIGKCGFALLEKSRLWNCAPSGYKHISETAVWEIRTWRTSEMQCWQNRKPKSNGITDKFLFENVLHWLERRSPACCAARGPGRLFLFHILRRD